MTQRAPVGLVEYRNHTRWAVVLLTLAFLALLGRFFLLQIMRGGEYRKEHSSIRQRTERIPAPRGTIVDRNGVLLAHNVETHDLVMAPLQVQHADRTEELLRRLLKLDDDEDQRLRELMKVGLDDPTRYDKIVLRRDLVSDWCPFDSTRLEAVEPKRKVLWCAQCGTSYDPLSSEATKCPHDAKHVLAWNDSKTGATCARCEAEFASTTACPHDGAALTERTFSLRCPKCGHHFNNERAIIEANLYQMKGLDVATSARRIYPKKNLTAHLLGYMAEVSQKDLDQQSGTYVPGDRIGRSGVERAFESELRGRWGRSNWLVDRGRGVQGTPRPDPDRPDEPMVEGATVRLTIDVELQALARRALRYQRSGAVAMVDTRNGEVLALYSKPSFNPNLWSGRVPPEVMAATRQSPYSPMLNKAITAYAPGSVYKIVTALAAMHEHTATERTEVMCLGSYEFGGRKFRCHDRGGHGGVDLVAGLERSCDVYFYKMGELLGMDTLHQYATDHFGFGMATGLEISESRGLVPNKEWHKKHGGWMPGYTLSTAVGQKDIRSTPLQVARAFAAVANGGQLYETHLVRQVEDRNGLPLRNIAPQVTGTVPWTELELKLIRLGLWSVVNTERGTAFTARLDGLDVAGKTGTAEAAETKVGVSEDVARWAKDDHAWFAGYAPSKDPEIAVVVFLEHGHSGGKAAAPVAMRIFQGYFARQRGATQVTVPAPAPAVKPTRPAGPGAPRPKDESNDNPNVNTEPLDERDFE